jgi:transcriptional regulator
MYVPSHFAATDAQIAQLLACVGAADLITSTDDGLIATFLPLLYDGTEHRLLGHVARNNPHWRRGGGRDTMVILRGPDAYVSPSWYPTKAEHGRVVPTWNYVTAHVYGRLRVHDDPEWVRGVVRALTERHEAGLAGRDGHTPWQLTDAPPAFIAGQLRAIVGVELLIERIEAKRKLSQNRSAADQDAVVAALRASAGGAGDTVAELMATRATAAATGG